MTHLMKSVLLAGCILATSLVSHANPGLEAIEVSFDYTHSLPIEESYALAQKTAKDACEISGIKGLSFKARAQECIVALLDQFVAQTGDRALIEYHAEQNNSPIPSVPTQIVASATAH